MSAGLIHARTVDVRVTEVRPTGPDADAGGCRRCRRGCQCVVTDPCCGHAQCYGRAPGGAGVLACPVAADTFAEALAAAF